MSRIRIRIRALLRRSEMERELDEVRFHIAKETEKNIREGLEPKEARRRALVAFGGVERHKEKVRYAWGVRWLEVAVRDVRYAARQLRRRPGFTVVAVATLALGIGANTAIFTVVKTVLLDPLPYPDADELVMIHNLGTPREYGAHTWTPTSVTLDLMRSSDSFEEIAGYYPIPIAVTGGERAYQFEGALITPNFFRLFQSRMALGRDFVQADARPGAPPTVIISYWVWQRHFGGSPDVIGRSIQTVQTLAASRDGELREIVGVVERGFHLYAPRAEDPALWIPDEHGVPITVARLREGVPLRHAQSELDVIVGRQADNYPNSSFDINPVWTTIKSEIVRNDRTALLILQMAVTAVLLIACVNMGNMLLARFGFRRAEVAIRSAMGASRGRLLRQAMTESVVLSALGGVAALLVTGVGLELLLALAPGDLPLIDEVAIDGSILLITLGVSVIAGLLIGVIPAMATSRRATNEVLKESGRMPVHSIKQRRISHALVISEVAMVLVLLVGAGLLARSFVSLTEQDPGFRTEDIVAVSLDIPRNRYRSVTEVNIFEGRVLERLRQIPGIESVAVSTEVPLDRGSTLSFRLDGDAEQETAVAQYDVVSEGYFRVLDIPLLSGRYLKDTDRRGTLPVVVIDEAMALAIWPGENPIGKRIVDGFGTRRTVVGVVGNVRGSGLAHDPRPGFYIPYRQRLDTSWSLWGERVFLIHSAFALETLAASLRQAIWAVEPNQPVSAIATVKGILSASVSPHRFRAVLLGSFAAIALILAVVGIYGVVEQLVTQRRHEFAIRMAIGARASDVLRMVIREGTVLAGIGVALGLLGTVALAQLLSALLFGVGATSLLKNPFLPQPPPGMLFGVSATDPVMIAFAATLLLAAVAVAASYVPARRAASVDPMVTLNVE